MPALASTTYIKPSSSTVCHIQSSAQVDPFLHQTEDTPTMAGTHHAAILLQKGGTLSLGERTTPEPGPTEVLIEVKAC